MGVFPPSFLTPSSLSVQGNVFQDAVFNQTVTITEKEDGLDGETYVHLLSSLLFSLFAAAILILLLSFLLLRIFMYVFLSGLGLLVIIGLHQLLESRKVKTSWIKSKILGQNRRGSPGPSEGQRCLGLSGRGRHVGFVHLGADLRCCCPCRGGVQLPRWKWEPPATTAWTSAGSLRKHSTRSVRVTSLPALPHFLCGLASLFGRFCVAAFVPPPPYNWLPACS